MASWFSLRRNKKICTLGLDISDSSVRLLELSYHNGRIQLENYGITALPDSAAADRKTRDPEHVSDAIRYLIDHTRPHTRDTVAAVPGTAVISRRLDVSRHLAGEDLEAQILLEADQLISFPLQDIALDFEVSGQKTADKQEVLLVACRLETVNLLQDTLCNGGLKPRVIDVETYALGRAVTLLTPHLPLQYPTPLHSPLLIAVADIGPTLTRLSVLRQGEIVYSKEQNTSHKVLKSFIAACVQQIRRALQLFYSSGAYDSIDYILLTGDRAAIPGLASVIEKYLGIPTQTANPFMAVSVSNRISQQNLRQHAPALMTAFGLAMRGIDHAKH